MIYIIKKAIIEMSNIEIYELVLQRKIKSFPSGFWVNRSIEDGKKITVELFQYLLCQKLKWSKNEVLNNVSKEFIVNIKLWTPVKLYFGKSISKLFMEVYPGQFMPFEFKNYKVSCGYWNVEANRVEAIRWLFNKKLCWDIEDIKEKFNLDVLKENGLGTLKRYYASLFKIVNTAYPEVIHPWELKQAEVPSGTWNKKDNRIKAIHWLINSLEWNHEDVIIKISKRIFSKYGLSSLLEKYYSGNAVKAIIDAFPNEYHRWEFKRIKA